MNWAYSKSPRRSSGFTLIELLIVIAIFSTLLALVAPLGVKTVKSAQAQSEKVKLTSMLSELSYRAYLANTPIEMAFRGNLMSLVVPSGESVNVSYSYLHFPVQQIVFDSNGLSQWSTLIVHVNGAETEISLDQITSQRGSVNEY